MKKVIFFATLIILLVTTLDINAVTKPKDVYGWGNVHWGMTAEEVQHTIGKEVKKRSIRHDDTDKMYSGLELKDIVMANTRLRASFWMSEETKKLIRIVFIPEVQPSQYEWAETFIDLESYLVHIYGDPDTEKTSNDPGTSADRKWIFPTTEIELSYLKLGESELLILVFSKTNIVKQ